MKSIERSFLIVVPCLNEENYITGLVKKLVLDNEGLEYQLIIVDGGSSDKTPELTKSLAEHYERVHYLHNPKKLQSSALNLAVKEFGEGAGYLVRLDAHAAYPKDFCRVLFEEAKKIKAECVTVAVDTVGQDGFQKAVAVAQNSVLGNGGSAHRTVNGKGEWVDHGHHALMSINAFEAVGGYDESFSHNEDAEMDHRLNAAGYKIWLTGKTAMTYFPRNKPIPLFWQYFKFGQGRVRNILKHKMRPHIRQMIPVGVAPAVALLLLSPFHPVFFIPFYAWVLICLTYGGLLAYKAKDKGVLLSGPAAMIMHFAWSLGFWCGLWEARNKRAVNNA